jgi:mono/diheme cytochrome c family protein
MRPACMMSILSALAGCGGEMGDQPRLEPQEPSGFFADGRGDRPPVPGTVARGQLRADPHLYGGRGDGFPFRIGTSDLQRGRERFGIFCSPCHGAAGDGNGMVVLRGFRRPPSFHDDRLRAAPPGQLFRVAADGFGAMPGYRADAGEEDLWRIVAYVRALQLSQAAPVDLLSPEERGRLK